MYVYLPFNTQVTVSFHPLMVHVITEDPTNSYPSIHDTVAVSPKVVPFGADTSPLGMGGRPQSNVNVFRYKQIM